MKTTNILMGITAILIAVMFIAVGIQGSLPQTSQHVNVNTMAEDKEYRSYLISNPVNASDQLSNMFITWIGDIEHANPYVGGKESAFHMPSQSQVKELFPLFLKKNPSAMQLLNKITARETAMFQKENHEAGLKFIRSLKNESKLPKVYEYSTNNSKFVAVNVAHPMYPGGFPTNTGEYVMVLMNYLSFTVNLGWLGSYTVNYGEQDTINILYVGSDAQTWYNQEYSTIQNFNNYNNIVSIFLAPLTAVGAYYGIEAITGVIAAQIFAIIEITGDAISMIQSYMGNQLHQMYDTTYANPLKGEPQMLWMFYTAVYIYSGFGSYFTWNGYTNSGTVSMLPYLGYLDTENPAFIVVSAALSGEAHGISGKIGWNNWGTES